MCGKWRLVMRWGPFQSRWPSGGRSRAGWRPGKYTDTVKEAPQGQGAGDLRLTVRFIFDAILLFPRRSGQEPVELGVLGMVLGEGHQGAADAEQALYVYLFGDVAQLGVRDMQEFRSSAGRWRPD